MSKSKYSISESRYVKYLSDGRGSGKKNEYAPWINVRDCPSQGKTSQLPGTKTGRAHQLLSKHELHYGLLLDWSDHVIDYQEQYPLDLSETIEIANAIGVKHPYDHKVKFPIVRTTDFLVTLKRNDDIVQIARTIKPAVYLEKQRTIELFEIERRYWKRRGIDWGIVTEKELPAVLCKNLETILPYYNLGQTDSFDHPSELSFALVEVLKAETAVINHVLREFDHNHKLIPGTALTLFKHLLARKTIRVDLNQEFTKLRKGSAQTITVSESWRQRYESSEECTD